MPPCTITRLVWGNARKAVAIGRLQGWGLAAAGKEGVVCVLEILENEIISAMGLLGVTSIDQLGPEYLTAGERVTQPHEMSAWANMPTPQGSAGESPRNRSDRMFESCWPHTRSSGEVLAPVE